MTKEIQNPKPLEMRTARLRAVAAPKAPAKLRLVVIECAAEPGTIIEALVAANTILTTQKGAL